MLQAATVLDTGWRDIQTVYPLLTVPDRGYLSGPDWAGLAKAGPCKTGMFLQHKQKTRHVLNDG